MEYSNAATGCHSAASTLDSMALRPCLSTGLPVALIIHFCSVEWELQMGISVLAASFKLKTLFS